MKDLDASINRDDLEYLERLLLEGKFTQASSHLAGVVEDVRELVFSLRNCLGDSGFPAGDLGEIVGRAVDWAVARVVEIREFKRLGKGTATRGGTTSMRDRLLAALVADDQDLDRVRREGG